MPPMGVAGRTMAAFARRWLINRVVIYRLKGVNKGLPDWQEVAVANGLLIEKGTTQLAQQSAKQVYSSQVVLRSGIRFSLPNERYRVRVEVLKSRQAMDDPEGPPEVAFTRELELVMVDTYPDPEGTEFLHLLRCQNGDSGQS